MKDAFLSILLKKGFEKEKAETCAEIFTKNTVDYPWGQSFCFTLKMVESGFVIPNKEPVKIHAINALEFLFRKKYGKKLKVICDLSIKKYSDKKKTLLL